MQTIKTIIGQPSEGKTMELMDSYIEAIKTTNTSNRVIGLIRGNENEKRETIRPVFISCEEPMTRILGTLTTKMGRVNFNDYHIHTVNNEKALFDCMIDHLKYIDCIFFIDMPLITVPNFRSKIDIFVDTYPNKNNRYSCDVVYTRSRSMAFR